MKINLQLVIMHQIMIKIKNMIKEIMEVSKLYLTHKPKKIKKMKNQIKMYNKRCNQNGLIEKFLMI